MADSLTSAAIIPGVDATFNDVTRVLTDKFGNTAVLQNGNTLIIKRSQNNDTCNLEGNNLKRAQTSYFQTEIDRIEAVGNMMREKIEVPPLNLEDPNSPENTFPVKDVGNLAQFCSTPKTPAGKGSPAKPRRKL